MRPRRCRVTHLSSKDKVIPYRSVPGTVLYVTIPYILFHKERKVEEDLPHPVKTKSYLPYLGRYRTVPYRTLPGTMPYVLFHKERKVVEDLPLSVNAPIFVPLRWGFEFGIKALQPKD